MIYQGGEASMMPEHLNDEILFTESELKRLYARVGELEKETEAEGKL